jgi:Zn-dependent protease with chaperone function
VVRVLLYPVTALLGPFVQDAIAATVKVGLEESGGLLPALTSSCESRILESEADIVALRLLSNAGIDPRASLSFWEDRLDGASSPRGGSEGEASHTHGSHAHAHTKEADSFMKTHPPDRERVSAIRKELARWTTTSVARN